MDGKSAMQIVKHKNTGVLFYLFIYLFIYLFGCFGSSLWCAGFSLVVARRLQSTWALFCGTRALSLRHASSVVVACGLCCPLACGILVPQPGIEPRSPALEGGFFTTGPPGKSVKVLFEYQLKWTSRQRVLSKIKDTNNEKRNHLSRKHNIKQRNRQQNYSRRMLTPLSQQLITTDTKIRKDTDLNNTINHLDLTDIYKTYPQARIHILFKYT